MIKKCCICKKEKSLSDYHKDKNKKDGLSTQCRECGIRRAKMWAKKNPERARINSRNANRKRHGITKEKYRQLLINQNNECKICKTSNERLCIDHDHKCCPSVYSCGECIRGLLCRGCNLALGILKEDLDIIENMKKYIQTYSSVAERQVYILGQRGFESLYV